MIGGLRFARARARDARATLVVLAVVTAVATALIALTATALRAVESAEVRAALAAGPVAEVSAGEVSPDDLAATVRELLAARGLEDAATVTIAGDEVTIAPVRLSGDDVDALRAALQALPEEGRDAVGTRVQVGGTLASTLDVIGDGLAARRVPATVAIGLLALLTVVVVGAAALEPVRARAAQSRLLRARGARTRSLAALTAAETAVVSAGGATVGAAAVTLVGVLVGAPIPGLLVTAASGLAVAGTATLVATVVTVRTVDVRSTRAQVAAFVGAAVVLAVVTGLAAWRFLGSGAVLATDDPLVIIAPALVLALVTLIAVLVATPLARGVGAALSPTRRVAPVTPLRLASRRPGRHALPITVVAFTVGIATIAAAYTDTVRALGDAPEALRVGADVRVSSIPDTTDAADVAAVADGAGASSTALARGFTAQGPGVRIPVTAIEGGAVGEVMLDAGGAIDPAAIGASITLQDAGIPLSGDSVIVTVAAPVPPPVEWGGEVYQPAHPLAHVGLVFVSDSGRFWESGFVNGEFTIAEDWTTGTPDPVHTSEMALPPGQAWSLIGLETTLIMPEPGATIEVTRVVSGDEEIDPTLLVAAPGTGGTVTERDGALVFAPTVTDSGMSPVTRAVAPGIPAAAPVVLTASLANSLSLDVGDRIALEFDGPDFEADVEVASIVPVLPGTPGGEGLLADFTTLALLAEEPLVANQVWIAADDPDAVASAVSAEFEGPNVLVADERQGAAAAGSAWAFVLAAVGAAILAVVVVLLRRTRSRADARELALLAVLGLGRRRAAGVRTAEDLFALAVGVLGGFAAGIATAWLIVPPLVRAAYGTVPVAYPVPLVWPWLPLVVAVAVLVAVLGVVTASVGVPRGLAASLREDE